MDWKPVVDAFVAGAVAVLTALLVSLRPVLVAWVQSKVAERFAKMDAMSRQFLRDAAFEAVSTAERLGGTGVEKKAMAVNYVMREVEEHDLMVSEESVEQVIEAMLSIARSAGRATVEAIEEG